MIKDVCPKLSKYAESKGVKERTASGVSTVDAVAELVATKDKAKKLVCPKGVKPRTYAKGLLANAVQKELQQLYLAFIRDSKDGPNKQALFHYINQVEAVLKRAITVKNDIDKNISKAIGGDTFDSTIEDALNICQTMRKNLIKAADMKPYLVMVEKEWFNQQAESKTIKSFNYNEAPTWAEKDKSAEQSKILGALATIAVGIAVAALGGSAAAAPANEVRSAGVMMGVEAIGSQKPPKQRPDQAYAYRGPVNKIIVLGELTGYKREEKTFKILAPSWIPLPRGSGEPVPEADPSKYEYFIALDANDPADLTNGLPRFEGDRNGITMLFPVDKGDEALTCALQRGKTGATYDSKIGHHAVFPIGDEMRDAAAQGVKPVLSVEVEARKQKSP